MCVKFEVGGISAQFQYSVTQAGGGGVYTHVKAYGDVLTKWLTFPTKILKCGSYFGPKIFLKKRVPFHKIYKKQSNKKKTNKKTKKNNQKKKKKSAVFKIENQLFLR